MNESNLIADAKREIDVGEVTRAHQILQPLVDKGNAQAIYIAATISKSGESAEEFEKRHVEFVTLAASKNYPDAIYQLGYFFDVGESGFEVDKKRAAELFKKAADLGHPRSQWIHACELLWGAGSYEQNVSEGLEYLNQAVKGNFDEALETLARFHESGEFGFERSAQLAADLRNRKAP